MPVCCDSDPVASAAADLLACVVQALDDCGAPVCRASLVPGATVAWDVCACGCCDEDGNPADGQLWVRVVETAPVPTAAGVQGCAPSWVVTLEVGLIRCVSTLDDRGNAPCAADLNADAAKGMRDAALVRRAVACCYGPTLGPFADVTVGAWRPAGPSGGCAGGTLEVRVGFDDAQCLPEA